MLNGELMGSVILLLLLPTKRSHASIARASPAVRCVEMQTSRHFRAPARRIMRLLALPFDPNQALMKKNSSSFDCRMKLDDDGSPVATVWMTPMMRKAWMQFGSVAFVDMIERRMNSHHWGHM